ncbi:hypothetical protein C1646_743832 [Rhizophagus diaphanus]|nr:hypothetical protein C1646_743832 [Rhizophagus diaphanus] [Rhizophagus sp. MUCL 43196]
MACSKIFSGDLPELISEIIQYFRNDLSTLHSCILVNRLWCRLAIPLLWEDPFSMKPPKNYIIEIYLHNLNDDDKTKLSEHGINMELIPSNTFFNYPNFIKRLNTWKLICSIEKWISAVKTLTTEEQFANYFMPETNFLSPLYPHFENITNTDFIQQIINLTKPFKLKSLFLDEVLQIEPLKSLLQKSGDFLENFGFGYGLGLYTKYLSLTLMINTNDFEIFLKNSQNIFIKKLLISNKMQGGIEVILPYIKKYIMKKNNIKYLAIMETFFENTTDIIFKSKDLFSLISLKDEVKEFSTHNIKVQNYYDLQIQVCEFIKEVD